MKLNNTNQNRNGISKILNRSTKAICGPFEREVIVKNKNLNTRIKTLKKSGYIIVGTGKAGFERTKVWFNPEGMML